MGKWKDCCLGEIITLQRGFDLPRTKAKGGKYPVVGSNGIIGYHDCYTTEAPSITIGRSGNVGKPFIYFGKTWAHNTTLFIKEFKQVDPVFTYYLLKTLNLSNYAGGSAVPTLNRNHLYSLPVYIPSQINDQQRIANFLHLLDDKIELNNQINGNLLEQAKTLFDSCYENAANKSVIFTDCIDVLSGGTPSTSNPKYWNGHIPFFSPKDVGKPYTFLTEKYISEEGLSNCNSKLYPAGTTFITARGTVGKVSLAGCPMAINQSCYALSSSVLDPALVYFYTLKTVESLKHKASGAVFDAITVKDFKTERIRKINATKTADLVLLINPIMDEIHYRTIESLKLAGLRDTLLPKLMSGEIDVSDIDL